MATPTQMLDAAELEFQQRRFTSGANLVWEAAHQSVADAAQHAKLPCCDEQDAYDIAALLDSSQPGEPVHHWLRLRVADAYRTQAAHKGEDGDWLWEPAEYIQNMTGIRLMVEHIARNGVTAGQ